MVSQELSHFFMFIEIVAVVNQPGDLPANPKQHPDASA
jgi:hypothetical protein